MLEVFDVGRPENNEEGAISIQGGGEELKRQERKWKRLKRSDEVSGTNNKKEDLSSCGNLLALDTAQKGEGKKGSLEVDAMDISLAVVAKQPRQAR